MLAHHFDLNNHFLNEMRNETASISSEWNENAGDSIRHHQRFDSNKI
jgi:hypothetical protein